MIKAMIKSGLFSRSYEMQNEIKASTRPEQGQHLFRSVCAQVFFSSYKKKSEAGWCIKVFSLSCPDASSSKKPASHLKLATAHSPFY